VIVIGCIDIPSLGLVCEKDSGCFVYGGDNDMDVLTVEIPCRLCLIRNTKSSGI
jgi:hypothetical protein